MQDPAEWQEYLAARAARKHQAELETWRSSKLPAPSPDTDGRLQRRLDQALKGPLDLSKVDTQLTRIAGEGQFDRLGYEGFTQNGVPGLRITTHEKSTAHLSSISPSTSMAPGVAAFNFSAGARVTFMDVAHHGGEWRNDLLFGSSNLAASEFYQPWASRVSLLLPMPLRPSMPAIRSQVRLASPCSAMSAPGAASILATTPDAAANSASGYEIFDGKLSPLIGSAGIPIVDGSTGQFRARYVWDGQDSPSVPSRGTRVVTTLSRVLQSPGLAHPIGQLKCRLRVSFRRAENIALL